MVMYQLLSKGWLSNLAVTLVERAWSQTYEQILTAPSFPFLAIRYVDNRYIIFPEERIEDPSLQTLPQEDFYQHPVELETVTNNELLGFIVDSQIRTIVYKLPEPWQIRDYASAGSLRLRLLGLQSRCLLFFRYTYPSTDCPDRIHSLIQLYIANGFQSSDCYKAIRKLTKETAESAFVVFGQSAVVCESHSACSKELFLSCYIYKQAGGNGAFMSPLPTKLLMNWEDITTDHRDVPAKFSW